MSFFVNALSICRWADRIEARSTLPQVLRRLVIATIDGVSEIDFPAHESVQRSGFDGVVVSSQGNAWVPVGRSVWELGVNKVVKPKADKDFTKRTEETPQEVQGNSCFVFVTPRHWEHKKSWASDQADTGHWKEVRAYDADDLEQWLETAPSVAVWFGGQIGSRPPGVDDVAARWAAISKCAVRNLLPSVFLAGREHSVERVRQWLAGQPDRLVIECRSPVEVVDFFCAAVAGMGEAERTAVEARTIIVENHNAWRVLRDAETPVVLVVDPSVALSSEEIARAVSTGHHILTAVEPSHSFGQSGAELERASQFDLTKALEECGYEPVKAEQCARAAGGSLAILKHRLARFPSSITPGWASDVTSEVITSCLLLGGWDGGNDADRAAFEKIAGRPYAACEAGLQQFATCREPLLLHAAGNWRLISKDHAWSTFEDRVSASALHEFESLAVEILADDDPRYALPEDERLYASIKGHVAKYSEIVKTHVAETLALLGAFGGSFEAASSTNIVAAVDRIVANVLSPTCTWHRWASLGSRLALLAEASPRSFLRAVHVDLDRSDPEVVKLLHEEEDAFFGRCNHAGLLWALEGLAWPKQHLGEVAQTLLALADRDPGRKWANRPKNSLCEILSFWMPYTTATVEERIKVLDLLLRHNREAAWPILLNLLPGVAGSFSTPTRMPYWRDWANEWLRGVIRAESLTFITATAERVIAQAGQDASRWKSVFEHVGRFPYTVRDQFLQAARTLSESKLSDTDRRLLAEELSKQINRHRYVEDANWSLPTEVLDELETILEQLKPESGILRNVWLFEPWPDRYFEREGSVTDNEKALDDARIKAIREVVENHGFLGIESMLEHAESANDVGRALSMATGDDFLTSLIPTKLEGDHKDLGFAKGFIWNRFYPDGWDWADKAVSLCSTDNSKALFLAVLPFFPAVWNRAEASGQEVLRLYWGRCRAFNPDLDSDDIATAVKALVAHDRPGHAIDLLSMARYKKREIKPETLLLPLEALLSLPVEKSKDQFGQTTRYHIQEIIETLQNREDVDTARLIPIEWHYLRLLDDHRGHTPRTLYNHLAISPQFFVEVLSLCFRSRKDDGNSERPEPTKQERYMAGQAFRLLDDWKRVPGTEEDGKVDETALRDWCAEARRLAEESGRLEVCDNHIGQVFAHAPEGDDGTWPCSAVRQAADEIATDSLGSGMSNGITNSRGAMWRAPCGDQERKLAQKYREQADRIRFDSPFVASVLDDVVQSYEGEAAFWDEKDRWDER